MIQRGAGDEDEGAQLLETRALKRLGDEAAKSSEVQKEKWKVAKQGGRVCQGGGTTWPMAGRSEGLSREPIHQAPQSGTGIDAKEVRLLEPKLAV